MRVKSDGVRYTRAGDQFHYRWAARRCLALLDDSTDLVCITIEGISTEETSDDNSQTGEEVVDVAEYYRSPILKDCRHVSYFQLKHTTQQADKPWTLSFLKNTIEGFSKRFKAFQNVACPENKQSVKFIFTTNRPAGRLVHAILNKIKKRALADSDKQSWKQLKGYLGADDDAEAFEFFDCFRIDDTNDSHWKQRNILLVELGGYIPGSDSEGAEQLWRLVTDKALPEHAGSPEITREDVLRVLNTNENKLFPTPCLIESGEHHFAREQEEEIFAQILSSNGKPVIIHADGGVGKTALANRLMILIPDNSIGILYDCFGNGTYRSAVQLRHGHNVGLVQIANELASRKLCHPLIPSDTAQPADYLKAFNYRLEQIIRLLKAKDSDAKLIIFVDAADNAEMAAEEYHERAGFPRDLIRDSVPDGVVIVYLCRSHRIEKLKPPIGYLDLQLKPFSETETEKLLKQKFEHASSNDVREFHRLSSQNPRVQATALSQGLELPETLEMLGPNPTSVEDTIKNLFEQAIHRLLDAVPETEANQIRVFCEALAALRPFIPIEVLSLASGMPQGAIRSFVTDLGRPLSIAGGAIQFFDEPSETWFRETYKPEPAKLGEFIAAIKPLSKKNSYVASALPQLMLEAGQYDQLIDLVLSDSDLPKNNPVDRRNTSLQRLQFALKAALRNKRYKDAAKLALKAGGETAGDNRQQVLIQENTDLVSRILPDHQLREIVAQKTFSTGWHGGHHAYEACLLSGCGQTLAESRSYLRLARKWVGNWSSLPKKERKKTEMRDEDIAEIAFAQLQLNGARGFVGELASWTPREVAYRVGKKVISGLVDLAEYEKLDEIGEAAQDNLCILLALIAEQNPILRYPSSTVVGSALHGLQKGARRLKRVTHGPNYEEPLLSVVNAVVQAAIVHKSLPNSELAEILNRYIPDPVRYYFSRFSDEPRFTLVRANCLRAALFGTEIQLFDLANPKLREELEKEKHYHDRDAQEFLEDVGAVFPWHQLWVKALFGKIKLTELHTEIEECLIISNSAAKIHYRDDRNTSKEISRIWLEIILLVNPTKAAMESLINWQKSLNQQLFTPALTHLTRVCARSTNLGDYTYGFAKEAFDLIQNDRMDAESKVDSYCQIARAVFAVSTNEASQYFDEAVEVAGKIGEENLDRWSSLLELSNSAADSDIPKPELAYRLSQSAELVYAYVARDKHFDWECTIEALTFLCPSSAPTILSRWKDREFGWDGRIFPYVINYLLESKSITPELALSLIGFRYQWNEGELLESTLSQVAEVNKRKKIFEQCTRYFLISGVSAFSWEKIVNLGIQEGWDTSSFQAQLENAQISEQIRERRENSSIGDYKPKSDPPKNWKLIFEDTDYSSPESIQEAHKKLWAGDPPYHIEPFTKELFSRVQSGNEAAALSAVFDVPDFSLYDLKGIFEAIPERWILQKHITKTLSEVVKKICTTHFYDIAKSRYYQPLPFEIITAKTGVTEEEIYRLVVEACAENPSILGSGRLFSLVGLITPMLSSAQAAEALGYGLSLLEEDMDEKDGDGEWLNAIEPPDTAIEAVAGYVWAALASPRTADRWEAAHVVCLMYSFGEEEALKHLADLAIEKAENPYHDQALPFYKFSAQQWLLIALRRAVAKDCHIAPIFREFLQAASAPDQRHVIIRGIAASILLELHRKGQVKLTSDEATRLESINKSKLELIESETYRRSLKTPPEDAIEENDKYYFGHDISQYWFESLGRIFSFGSGEVEKRALKIIREEWKLEGRGGWAQDARAQRDIFRDRETSHSHGSYPKTEDLSFYHSYNSMMIVAGQLIDTVQRHQSPGNLEYDELEEWLNRHGLSRTDGLWLADRRDPNPLETRSWKGDEETDDWPFTVQKSELENMVWFEDGKVCVWGSWNNSSSDREEQIRVSSALVSPKNSIALLNALQTTYNTFDYGIPTSGGELEINSTNYTLTGWVHENSREHGIDEYDPWAGDINYPALKPGKWFLEKFDLKADYECRNWHEKNKPEQIALCSRMWGRKSEERESYRPETGQRLTVPKNVMLTWLRILKKDLILEVTIDRDFRYESYQRKKRAFNEYIPPYTLIMVLKTDGTIETI